MTDNKPDECGIRITPKCLKLLEEFTKRGFVFSINGKVYNGESRWQFGGRPRTWHYYVNYELHHHEEKINISDRFGGSSDDFLARVKPTMFDTLMNAASAGCWETEQWWEAQVDCIEQATDLTRKIRLIKEIPKMYELHRQYSKGFDLFCELYQIANQLEEDCDENDDRQLN